MRKDKIAKVWAVRDTVADKLCPPGQPGRAQKMKATWNLLEPIFKTWRTEKEIDEYSAEELDEYREKEVAFFKAVVKEYGGTAVSNYMHSIGVCARMQTGLHVSSSV